MYKMSLELPVTPDSREVLIDARVVSKRLRRQLKEDLTGQNGTV